MENVVQMAWPFILMGVIFYFMIYRPQKRDQKKRANMLDSLKVGTRIVTIGGIFGEIAKIKDDRIRIKVAEDVEIWIRRAAVGTVITTELQKAAKEEKSEAKAEEKELDAAEQEALESMKALTVKYETAMEDDFNTADAISALFEMVKLANTNADRDSSRGFLSALRTEIDRLCDVLGIITEKKEEVLDSQVEEMIAARQQARKEKNFALADELRGKLLEMGIVLEDTREGVKWKRA